RGLPPDLLIVLDRSGSMADPISSGGNPKWQEATSAINTVVGMLQGQIKWGLEYFPTDLLCDQAGIAVPVSLNSASAISSSMVLTSPGGATPTRTAISHAAAYL